MDFVKKTKKERTLESLIAENKELRERVEKLEAQVSAIMEFHKSELEMRIRNWSLPNTRSCATGPVFNSSVSCDCPPCFR